MTNAHNNNSKNGSTNGTRRGKRRGFTLIEILIVVVILGVLAALVIPGVTSALSDANGEARTARASQITTMVTRLNAFKPDQAIALTDGAKFSATGLNALVTNSYCTPSDLLFPGDDENAEGVLEADKWEWSSTKNAFVPYVAPAAD